MSVHKLLYYFKLGRLLILGAVLVTFLMVTSPAQLPSVMVILPFVGLFGIIYFALLAGFELRERFSDATAARRRLVRPRATAALGAGLPVLLLILQSIGQLTVWDVLTALAIFLIAYFYVSRSSLTTFDR